MWPQQDDVLIFLWPSHVTNMAQLMTNYPRSPPLCHQPPDSQGSENHSENFLGRSILLKTGRGKFLCHFPHRSILLNAEVCTSSHFKTKNFSWKFISSSKTPSPLTLWLVISPWPHGPPGTQIIRCHHFTTKRHILTLQTLASRQPGLPSLFRGWGSLLLNIRERIFML